MIKIATFVAVLAFAGSAMADSPVSATLKAPVKSSDVTAGGVVWTCKADVCTALSDTSDLDAPDMCEGLTREVGEVTKFAGLSDAALAKCNRVARKS